MSAWNIIIKQGILKGFKQNSGQVDHSTLSPFFIGLSAFHIEHLLCELGKSIRRVKKGTRAKLQEEIDIDDIVKRHLNINIIKI